MRASPLIVAEVTYGLVQEPICFPAGSGAWEDPRREPGSAMAMPINTSPIAMPIHSPGTELRRAGYFVPEITHKVALPPRTLLRIPVAFTHS